MKKTVYTALLFSIFLLSCHKNVVTGKRAFTMLPESEMMAMSFTEYDKFLSEHPPLPASDERVQLVKRCGTKIQKAVEQFYADKKATRDLDGFNWAFNVVDENTINAWCMPGGKVVVYTGLLPITKDEQSLAVVLGHEIAHAVARHGNQRMSQALVLQFGGTALSVAIQTQPAMVRNIFEQSYGIGTTLGTLKYSRNHETEADKMGLIFAAMAGYDPEVAIGFWQRMASMGGEKPPQLLSTHPSDATRIKDLEAFMPEAKKYYKPS
ncbi:MAG: M48 family metallopeptidase [bacterium]|nr:M48 family metallopeptidase [bacterium]